MACVPLRTCCPIDYLIPFARQLGGRYTLTACALLMTCSFYVKPAGHGAQHHAILRVTVHAGRKKNVLLTGHGGQRLAKLRVTVLARWKDKFQAPKHAARGVSTQGRQPPGREKTVLLTGHSGKRRTNLRAIRAARWGRRMRRDEYSGDSRG